MLLRLRYLSSPVRFRTRTPLRLPPGGAMIANRPYGLMSRKGGFDFARIANAHRTHFYAPKRTCMYFYLILMHMCVKIRRGQPHCSALSQMSASTSAATVKYGP